MCGKRFRSSPVAGSTRPVSSTCSVEYSSPELQTAGGVEPIDPGVRRRAAAGFGGPEGPDDVMPFLRNVTRGRGIPDERLVEVSHHYQHSTASRRSTSRTASCIDGAARPNSPPRHRPAGATGATATGRRTSPTWSRRPRDDGQQPAARPRDVARTRPTPRAGSTARTSGWRCRPTGPRRHGADRQGAALLRPARVHPCRSSMTRRRCAQARPAATGLRWTRDRLHHPFHPDDDGGHVRFGRAG